MIWLPTTIAGVALVRCLVLEIRTRALEHKLARLRSINAFLRSVGGPGPYGEPL